MILKTQQGYSLKTVVKNWPSMKPYMVHTEPLDFVNAEGWRKLVEQRDAYGPAEGMLYSLKPHEQLMLMEFIILSEQELQNV